MRNPLFILFFIVVIWFFFAKESVVTLGPGVLASDPPKQTDIASAQSFAFKDFEVTALAKFQIKAKVLSKENYRWGREADLSPVDLALGWGTMSDESVLDAIEISQSNRWYTWWTDDFPIPRRDIETQSANMHLIPANSDIESLINKARRGDIIEISGSLVRVDAKEGWRWVSSLRRTDTGSNACELVWVDTFKIVDL